MKTPSTLPNLALDMLKNLVDDTSCAECCVCNDEVMSCIMAPFATMLEVRNTAFNRNYIIFLH